MAQDTHQAAREAYEDCKEAWKDNHTRMLEDLRFSNPADPQQWPSEVKNQRVGRICETFDRSNQYITQVVNEGRKNKPGVKTLPAEGGDKDVAEQLDGIFRHIEYRSRASIAYDTALDSSARCGIGWIRVVPRVVDVETEQQEICIDRVLDPLSCMIDGIEPDGADAMNGFAETLMSKREFKRKYPNASLDNWVGTSNSNWLMESQIKLCERQYVQEEDSTRFLVTTEHGDMNLSEEEYHQLAQQIGYQPEYSILKAKKRTVKWCKFNGNEILEETVFPGEYIGIVPVIGFEAMLDGKRYLCGLTRRLMPSLRAYNYERSALIEAIALQPKAPVLVPTEALGPGVDDHWRRLNTGQPAYLPYNSRDDDGNQINKPERLSPPIFPEAFVRAGQVAIADAEAAVGMNQAILGQPNNATSGRQERERREQGATATFHFIDNLSRSVEQVARICVGIIPIVMQRKQMARILGIDGSHGQVMVDPEGPQKVKRGKKVIAINIGAGKYDVRAVAGPSYVTQREEAGEAIQAAIQSAPDFAPVLMPMLMKMRDWPGAEQAAKAMIAMAPPPVQEILKEGNNDEEEIDPNQLKIQLMQMLEQMQQMGQMLDAAEKHISELESKENIEKAKLAAQVEADESNEDIARYKAETERMKVVMMDEAQMRQIAMQTFQELMAADRADADRASRETSYKETE